VIFIVKSHKEKLKLEVFVHIGSLPSFFGFASQYLVPYALQISLHNLHNLVFLFVFGCILNNKQHNFLGTFLDFEGTFEYVPHDGSMATIVPANLIIPHIHNEQVGDAKPE
jgi:hypothetical protein